MLTDESFQNKTTPGVPDVFDNPYSWNKHANMLFMETPPGVGYSYCGSGTGNGSAPKCHWNDHTQAVGNYNALLKFFEGFPELKENEFFITGESYGGMCAWQYLVACCEFTVASELHLHRNYT